MPSKRRYPPQICCNPSCEEEFIPTDRRQEFCSAQCRINYHNDKRYIDREDRYFREAPLRRCDDLLESLIDSPFYKEEQIREEVLDGFDIDRTIGTLEMNLLTGNPIRWYHTFGIELIEAKTYTIHQRTKL